MKRRRQLRTAREGRGHEQQWQNVVSAGMLMATARPLCQTSQELDNAECWQGNGDFSTLVHADGSVGYCSNLGNNLAYLVKLSTGRPYNTAIPLLV